MGCCWGLNALISEITLSLISSSEDSSMYLYLNRESNKDDNLNSVTVQLPIYRGLMSSFTAFFIDATRSVSSSHYFSNVLFSSSTIRRTDETVT